jgi:hypothetical protein
MININSWNNRSSPIELPPRVAVLEKEEEEEEKGLQECRRLFLWNS